MATKKTTEPKGPAPLTRTSADQIATDLEVLSERATAMGSVLQGLALRARAVAETLRRAAEKSEGGDA